MDGIQAYYKVYSQWPANWQAVRDTGLVQVLLHGPNGQVIDPDDSALDFPGDIRYLGSHEGKPPSLVKLCDFDGMYTRTIRIAAPVTYLELIQAAPPEVVELYGPAAQDVNRRIQWGIAGILEDSLMYYYIAHDRHVPPSFDDLLASGLTPIDATSINPLTGTRFFGDGRPNDFWFEPYGDSVFFLPTDSEGKHPWNMSF